MVLLEERGAAHIKINHYENSLNFLLSLQISCMYTPEPEDGCVFATYAMENAIAIGIERQPTK